MSTATNAALETTTRWDLELQELDQRLKDYETTLEMMRRSSVSPSAVENYAREVELVRQKKGELEASRERPLLGKPRLTLLKDCDGRDYYNGVTDIKDSAANLAKIVFSRRFASDLMFGLLSSGTDFALNLTRYRDELMRHERDFVESLLGGPREGFPGVVDMAHVTVLPVWLDDRVLRQFFQGRVFYLSLWMKDRKIPRSKAEILVALSNVRLSFRALLGCDSFTDVFDQFCACMMHKDLNYVPDEFWRVLLEDTLMRSFEILQKPYVYESVKITCEAAPTQIVSCDRGRYHYSAVKYIKARFDRLVKIFENPKFLDLFHPRSAGMKKQLELKFYEYKMDDEKAFPNGAGQPGENSRERDEDGPAGCGIEDLQVDGPGMVYSDTEDGDICSRSEEINGIDRGRRAASPARKRRGLRSRSPERSGGVKRGRSHSPHSELSVSDGTRVTCSDGRATSRSRSASREWNRHSDYRRYGHRGDSRDRMLRSRSPSGGRRGRYGDLPVSSRRTEGRFRRRDPSEAPNLRERSVCMQTMLKLVGVEKSNCRFGGTCRYAHFYKLEDCPLEKLQEFLLFRGLKEEHAAVIRERYAVVYPEVASGRAGPGVAGEK